MKDVFRPQKKPPRIVLYGPPKVGKSTFGSDAPNPIFVCTEDGVDAIPVDQFPVSPSWQDILTRVKQVAEEDHDYETIVLDTLNGVADLCAQFVCETQYKGDWGPKGFGSYYQGWMSTGEEIRRLLPLLDACRKRGMICILLCHAGTQKVPDPLTGDFQKHAPDLDRRVWARFSAWADMILHAQYEYCVIQGEDKKNRAVGDATRILRSAGSISEDAGVRVGYNLPEQLDLSWQSLEDALEKPNGIIESIERLWPLLNKQEATKGLAYLRIDSISDISKAQLGRARVVHNRLLQKQQAEAGE